MTRQALPQPSPRGVSSGASTVPVLSPVPTTQEGLDAARRYLAERVGLAGRGYRDNAGVWVPATSWADCATPADLERVDGLLQVAAALIEQYAPGAPAAVKTEASVRFCGYLNESPGFGAVRATDAARQPGTEGAPGGRAGTEYVVNHGAMFRTCGAMGLLTRWKVRRAGAVG